MSGDRVDGIDRVDGAGRGKVLALWVAACGRRCRFGIAGGSRLSLWWGNMRKEEAAACKGAARPAVKAMETALMKGAWLAGKASEGLGLPAWGLVARFHVFEELPAEVLRSVEVALRWKKIRCEIVRDCGTNYAECLLGVEEFGPPDLARAARCVQGDLWEKKTTDGHGCTRMDMDGGRA